MTGDLLITVIRRLMAQPKTEDMDEAGTGTGRRCYERPRILSREPLEAVAAVCAPTPPAKGNPGMCPTGPISS